MNSSEVHNLVDEKLEKCKNVCDSNNKLDKTTFYWAFGILIGIISSLMSIMYSQIQSVKETSNLSITEIKVTLAKIEANTESTTKQVDQLSKLFSNYNIKVTD